MTTPDEKERDLNVLSAECSRIGFDVHELAGLAFSDRSAFTSFLDFLREVPDGVGLADFRERMRKNGFNL